LNETQNKIQQSELSVAELINHFREKCKICGHHRIMFREKCKICGHHRIMHNELDVCEGVMNKPCTSGCDKFEAE